MTDVGPVSRRHAVSRPALLIQCLDGRIGLSFSMSFDANLKLARQLLRRATNLGANLVTGCKVTRIEPRCVLSQTVSSAL